MNYLKKRDWGLPSHPFEYTSGDEEESEVVMDGSSRCGW